MSLPQHGTDKTEHVLRQFMNLPWHLPAVRIVMQMTTEDLLALEEAERDGLDAYLVRLGEVCASIGRRGVRY
jgi:hypothetical protein